MTRQTMKERNAPTTGRRYLTDFESVEKEEAKLCELHARMKTCARDVEVLDKLTTKRGKIGSARERELAHVELLSAGDFTSPPPARNDVLTEQRNKRKELRAFEIAVGRQERAVQTAKVHASVEICRTVERDFRGLSQAIVDGWFGLIAALDAEEMFRANLREEGIGLATLPNVDVSAEFRQLLGTPRRPNGAFAGMVQSAKRAGYTIPQ